MRHRGSVMPVPLAVNVRLPSFHLTLQKNKNGLLYLLNDELQQFFHLMKEQGFRNDLHNVLNGQSAIDGEAEPMKYLFVRFALV